MKTDRTVIKGDTDELIHAEHGDRVLFDNIVTPRISSGMLYLREEAEGVKFPERLHGSSKGGEGFSIEGNYIRVSALRWWSPENVATLKNRFKKLNENTEEFNFYLMNVTDFEEDPGERTWPASFSFFAYPKNEELPEIIKKQLL